MTVNALQPSAILLGQQRYTQNDLMVDPLIVLRCDQRVYRLGALTFVSYNHRYTVFCMAPLCATWLNTLVQGLFIVKFTDQLGKS